MLPLPFLTTSELHLKDGVLQSVRKLYSAKKNKERNTLQFMRHSHCARYYVRLLTYFSSFGLISSSQYHCIIISCRFLLRGVGSGREGEGGMN